MHGVPAFVSVDALMLTVHCQWNWQPPLQPAADVSLH